MMLDITSLLMYNRNRAPAVFPTVKEGVESHEPKKILAIVVIVLGVVNIALGITFITIGASKQSYLQNAMDTEQITLSSQTNRSQQAS